MKRSQIFGLVFLLTIFGALNTIQLKLQNIQIVNPANGQKFFHPFIQTIYLFIGQTFVGLIYFYYSKQPNKQQKQLSISKSSDSPSAKHNENLSLMSEIKNAFLPALFDLLGTLFAYLALNTVNTVVWQMSKGGVIISTAILSKIILKRTFSNRAIVGCLFAFVGITTVQIVAVTTNTQSSITQKDQFIGISLLSSSLPFSSRVLDSSQKRRYLIGAASILQKQYFSREQLESSLCALCPWMNKTQCVCITENDCYLQSYAKYFDSLGNSPFLIALTIGCICSITISAPIGAYLSKHVSPVSRSLGIISRTVLIWLFNIGLTLTLGQAYPEYKLQSRSVSTNVFYGVGFGILLLGIYFYYSQHEAKDKKD